MLTQLEAKWISFLFKQATKAPSIPLKWTGRYLVLKKSNYYYFLASILFCVNALWASLYFLEFWKSIQTRHYFGITLNFIHGIGQIGSILLRIILWKYTQEVSALTNWILHFNLHEGKKEFGQKFSNAPIRQTLFVSAVLNTICVLVVHFVVTDVVYAAGTGMSPPKRILYLLINFVLTLDCGAEISVLGFSLFLIMVSIRFWIEALWKRMSEICKFILLRSKRSLTTYRNLTLMMELYNQFYGKFLIPSFIFCTECLIQVSVYCVIRLHKEMDIFNLLFSVGIFLGSVSFTVPMILQMSLIHSYSFKFNSAIKPILRRFKNPNLRNTYLKQLKSAKIMSCSVGNFYAIDKKAVLTLLDSTLQGIVSTLVMLS